jgi:hypothetical protein
MSTIVVRRIFDKNLPNAGVKMEEYVRCKNVRILGRRRTAWRTTKQTTSCCGAIFRTIDRIKD